MICGAAAPLDHDGPTYPRTSLDGIAGVRAAVGAHLGYSEWLAITDEQVDRYGQATGDRDEHAGIVPSYFVLALSNLFLPQITEVRGVSLGVNYGCNRIRFPAVVSVGSMVRAGAEITAVDDIAGGVQATMTIVVEIEGGSEPACVIESVSRYLT